MLAVELGPPTGDYLERAYYTYGASHAPRSAESLQAREGADWVSKRHTEYAYDGEDRLWQTIYPDLSFDEYGYDPSGSIATYQDPRHDEPNVHYRYDLEGRLTRVEQFEGTGWAVTEYGYDTASNLVSVTDANGNVTIYGVDDFGQTYLTMSPVTGTTKLSYNAAGRLVSSVDARGVMEAREYDDAGNLLGITYNGDGDATQSTTFTYEKGLRVSGTAVDEAGKTVLEQWTHDRRGLLLRHNRQLPDLARSLAISYAYDEEGHLTSQASGCATVDYVLDHAGRPTQITAQPADCSAAILQVADSIEYLPFGPATSMTRGTMEEGYEYDMKYQMISYGIATDPVALISRTYHYDTAGNLATVTDNLASERNLGLEYDDLDRLQTSTRLPASTRTYQYDSLGNRTYLTDLVDGQPVTTTEYVYTGGTGPMLQEVRITQAGQPQGISSVQYDQAGSVTDDSSSAYTYDLRNNMVLHSTAAPEEDARLSFRHDSLGRRVLTSSELANGWSVDHLLLSDGRPFIEVTLDGGQNEVEEQLFIHAGQRLLATVSGSDVSHVISDHVGFPLAVADEQGNMLWHASHQGFGEVDTVHEGTGAADPLRRYPGQWKPDPVIFSAPTNLYFNGYRWYSPAWGRYTQADPLGLQGGLGLYAYAGLNPLRFSDPYGLCKIELGFQKIEVNLPMVGKPYHAYIVITEPSGDKTRIDASPSIIPPDAREHLEAAVNTIPIINPHDPGPLGYLTAERDGDGVELKNGTVVLDDSESCTCYLKCLDEQISGLNQAELSYHVIMRNSNTGAYNLLKRCGHSPPPPTVAAGGWQFELSW